MSIKTLIFRIAKDYGIGRMAEDLGLNPSTFKNKVNIHMDSHNVYAQELELIADIADTDEVAKYFAEQRGLMCIKKPDFEGLSDSAILDLFLALQKEQGEWANKISESLVDGKITWNELEDIQKEYNEFVVAGAEIMSRLQAYMAVSEESTARKLQAVK